VAQLEFGWTFGWGTQMTGLAGPLFLRWVAQKTAISLVAPVSKGLFFSTGISYDCNSDLSFSLGCRFAT